MSELKRARVSQSVRIHRAVCLIQNPIIYIGSDAFSSILSL